MSIKLDKKSKIIIGTIFAFIIVIMCVYIILKLVLFPLKYFDIVKEEASKNNLDPYLVLSIIKTESNFNKDVISNKEAKGLMQIMDSTASEVAKNSQINLEDDLYNENTNIALGCNYFASLIKKYNGNYYLAILAYNAGMGNVDEWIKQGIIDENLNNTNVSLPYKETTNYLKRVIFSYKVYRIIY